MESNEVDKATEPLQKAKRESDDDSAIVILKKQKKEIDEITKSLKEMSEVVKTLQENSLTKADLEEILLKVKETPNKKVEPIHECCFEASDARGNDRDTIFVRGFDCSFPRHDIKISLKKHFGQCGEIRRVFIPFECLIGVTLGFAFINLRYDKHLTRDTQKMLKLDGSYLGGLKLEVMMAIDSDQYCSFTNFKGCQRCRTASHMRIFDNFYKYRGGGIHPRIPELDCLPAHKCGPYESDEDESSEDDQEAMVTNNS